MRLLRVTELVCGLAYSVTASSLAVDSLPHRFTDALVIGGVAKGGRTPIRFDALESLIVLGTFKAPNPGDTLTAADGTVRTWEPITLVEGKNRIEHASLGNGYAYASMESDSDCVAILDASGHSLVYVNGVPRTGDPYGYGFTRLPVALQKGVNEFLFVCGRGGFSAELLACPSDQPRFLAADDTLPHLVVGDASPVELAIVVENPSLTTVTGLAIELRHCDGTVTRTALPALLPCSAHKARATLNGAAVAAAGPVPIDATLVTGEGDARRSIAARSLLLKAIDADKNRNVTFVSDIDGSVQYYAVVPALAAADERPGLILSLHGASVKAQGQANCYKPKESAIVVCPTNRRPYGFDWEDWGRLDALEVLALAQRRFNTDPRRQWLTGHSMGGHGTWQLGAHFPDRFAAIAPSAGWISFRSYGAGAELGESEVERIFRRAMSPSDTLALGRNYAGLGVYVLHGEIDDNVPVGQARAPSRRTRRATLLSSHRPRVP